MFSNCFMLQTLELNLYVQHILEKEYSIRTQFHKITKTKNVVKLKKGRSIKTIENKWFSVTKSASKIIASIKMISKKCH